MTHKKYSELQERLMSRPGSEELAQLAKDRLNAEIERSMFQDEEIQCVVCKAVLNQKDVDLWCHHKSVGVVCRHHHGIKEWYDGLLKEANDCLAEISWGKSEDEKP